MEQILKFLQDAGTWYIATDDHGQPRVRPFGAQAIINGKLYIATNNTKDVYKQILENPKVEISGMAGGKWIRFNGELHFTKYNDNKKGYKNAECEPSGHW